jgi:extracellular factor (EF) 3-hydroxypalmitic acid methyl ester biosynthesis protein
MQSGATLLQDLSALIETGQYLAALNSLRHGLTKLRAEVSPNEWRTFCAQTFATNEFRRHPLSRLLKAGPLGAVCAETARGAVNHPLALDVIYGVERPQSLNPAASEMQNWELALGFCASLRARRLLLARELNELGNVVRYPRVLAVGCGHLREAATAFSLENMRGGEFVAFDRDRACLDSVQREYQYPGLRTLSGSLRDLIHADATFGKFDLIYLPTLLDTLEDFRVSALLASLLPLLESGGRLLAANFSPHLKDAAYLEACLDWWPLYRGEEQLSALTEPLDRALRGQAIFQEESGGSIFLDLQAL